MEAFIHVISRALHTSDLTSASIPMIITLCSHLRVQDRAKKNPLPPSGAIPHEAWWQTAGVSMVLVQDLDILELFFGGKCHPAYNPVSSLHCKLDTSAKVWRGASGPGRTSTFLVIPVVTGLTRGGYDRFGIIPEIAPG
jgi:hypothetical protein